MGISIDVLVVVIARIALSLLGPPYLLHLEPPQTQSGSRQ
jgi:hypothetical protein